MRALVGSALAVTLVAFAAACGGGSGGGNQNPSNGGNNGGGGSTQTNPCVAALASDEGSEPIVGTEAANPDRPVRDKIHILDGDPRGRAMEAMWLHQAALMRASSSPLSPDLTARGATAGASIGSPAADVGDIAVVQDQGDIVLPGNTFDLKSAGLRFTPSGGGYAVSKIDGNFRAALGNRVTLADDDSAQVDVPFGFSFYGTSENAAFVNSDGNVTFGEEDKASTDRNVARLLTGPARVSPFLSDLDPSSGGKVFVNASSDQYTVTWCAVRGFDTVRTVTAQASLFPDGSIEFKYGDFALGDAVVGLSPGRASDFTPSDLSVPNPASGSGAIGERFAEAATIDLVAAAKAFYATHPDSYDQLLIWTDQELVGAGNTFAFETTVGNEIRGIGQDIYDLSREFGSAGRLRSLVLMDFVGKYPDNPNEKFLGENNTLSVMGQEVGHRWLAYMNFRDRTGVSSDALLGRDLAHWSFFFNSEASVMEGNEITDLGGGQFKTTDAVRRYNRLDQYAMGLIPPSLVGSMFYVESPTGTHKPGDPPQIGVTFSGTRRDFLVDDVIAVNGPRVPSSADAPKTHRQAFLFIVSKGKAVDNAGVAKVDNIRKLWEDFFHTATENRMTAVTRLR